MNRVVICDNAMLPATWRTFEVEGDIRPVLEQNFSAWPDNAHIYHNYVAKSHEVTPHTESDVERLGMLKGTFYVVIYPEGFAVILAVIAIAVAAVSIALAFLLRPKTPNTQEQSPNNQLSDRQNQERMNQRIPDIYGELWATPDLIQLPYRIFENQREVEYCYMCIGRGYFDVQAVRDDQTLVELIDGESAEVYGPFTSPNSGDAPQLRIGTAINKPVLVVKKSSAVNGQILLAPNAFQFKSNKNILFISPDTIKATSGSGIDFTNFFSAGTLTDPHYLILTGANANNPAGSATINLDGTFEITSVAPDTIVLANPATVNSNWSLLAGLPGGQSIPETVEGMVQIGSNWIGPIIVDDPAAEEIWCNFVAQNGLWWIDDDGNQQPYPVILNIEITAIDSSFNPVGLPSYYGVTMPGSAYVRSLIGTTQHCILPFKGACQVRVRRITNTDTRKGQQFSDQTQWRDLYSVSHVSSSGQSVAVLGTACPWSATPNPTMSVTGLYPATGTAPASVAVVAGKTIRISYASGVASIGGSFASYDSSGTPGTNGRTGGQIGSKIPGTNPFNAHSLLGCFADAGGVIVDDPFYIGNSFTAVVPVGATQLLMGMDDGTTWSDNYGSWIMSVNTDVSIGGDFGNVTTIQTKTWPTQDALAIKERKINCLVTRMIEDWNASSGTYTQRIPTKSVADAFINMALDEYIGRRDITELDTVDIFNQKAAIDAYFGTTLCSDFCYTFDDSKVSFEEMCNNLGMACFVNAYRRGKILSLFFEKATANSLLLFNHRNKIPNSETRTVTFGGPTENDGLELTYNEPNAPNTPNIDTPYTLYFPPDQSAKAPKKITAAGIRNLVQAKTLGWRLYNKLIYQNTVTEFEGLQESALLILNNRILVADNTRTKTQDGYVKDQSGLTLTLSQKVTFVGGRTYTIFLLHYDQSVEGIIITAGVTPYEVVLATAPSLPCVTDLEKAVQTNYLIVDDSPTRKAAFLLTGKSAKTATTYNVSAANYDDRYYEHDSDFTDGLVNVFPGGTYEGSGGGYTSGDIGGTSGASGTPTPVTPTPNSDPPPTVQAGTTLHVTSTAGGTLHSIPHGLNQTPTGVIVNITSDGHPGMAWLQYPTKYDTANVYLFFSAAGIKCDVICLL